jgi:hypothetical protein
MTPTTDCGRLPKVNGMKTREEKARRRALKATGVDVALVFSAKLNLDGIGHLQCGFWGMARRELYHGRNFSREHTGRGGIPFWDSWRYRNSDDG